MSSRRCRGGGGAHETDTFFFLERGTETPFFPCVQKIHWSREYHIFSCSAAGFNFTNTLIRVRSCNNEQQNLRWIIFCLLYVISSFTSHTLIRGGATLALSANIAAFSPFVHPLCVDSFCPLAVLIRALVYFFRDRQKKAHAVLPLAKAQFGQAGDNWREGEGGLV